MVEGWISSPCPNAYTTVKYKIAAFLKICFWFCPRTTIILLSRGTLLLNLEWLFFFFFFILLRWTVGAINLEWLFYCWFTLLIATFAWIWIITYFVLIIFQERQTSKEGSSQCAFRISSEGLPLLLPYISKQILSASLVDFDHLLRYRTIKFTDFVDSTFGEKASNLMLGCCVVVMNKGIPAGSWYFLDALQDMGSCV